MKNKTFKSKSPTTLLVKSGAVAPWFHFSVDDIFESLIEITDKKIPLFEHPYFALLQEMHTKYGIHASMYIFFQKKINGVTRNLTEVRDLKSELAKAGEWLHFGPHALDFETMPYSQSPAEQKKIFNRTYDEIDRFAGKNSYAEWVRLHFYSESYELAEYFAEKGVTALFSTDRPAGSHRMPQEIKDQLNNSGDALYQGAHFIRTQFRVEFLTNENLNDSSVEDLFREALVQYGYVTLYTHEYELEREEVRIMFRTSMRVLHSLSVLSLKN